MKTGFSILLILLGMSVQCVNAQDDFRIKKIKVVVRQGIEECFTHESSGFSCNDPTEISESIIQELNEDLPKFPGYWRKDIKKEYKGHEFLIGFQFSGYGTWGNTVENPWSFTIGLSSRPNGNYKNAENDSVAISLKHPSNLNPMSIGSQLLYPEGNVPGKKFYRHFVAIGKVTVE